MCYKKYAKERKDLKKQEFGHYDIHIVSKSYLVFVT